MTTPEKYSALRSPARTVPLSGAGGIKHRAPEYTLPVSCAAWSHSHGPPRPHEQYFGKVESKCILLTHLPILHPNKTKQMRTMVHHYKLCAKYGEGDRATVPRALDLRRRMRQ